MFDETLARHHKLFGLCKVIALGDILLKRAGVHANANRAPSGARGIDHGIDLGPIADVAGLMRSLAAPALTAPMASLWLKWISATIGTGDSAQIVRKPQAQPRWARSRAQHHNPPGQAHALAQALPGVGGIGAGHGLDHHRCAATDLNAAHMHGARQLARQRMG